MVIRVLLVSFVMASATPRLSPCVPAEGSCNPSLDRCCQGPGLMTCRLRSNTKDAGMSYKCGAEFTHQAVSQPKCIPEGDFCDTDSRTCCQLEDKMPLKCIKPEHEKADSTGEVRPKCLAEAETFSDYTLAAAFSGLGLVLCTLPFFGFGLGLLVLLLGVLFFVQAGRVRFVFDNEAFAVQTLSTGEELEKPGENIVVGGENRWKYSSFVNWEFFPKGLVEKGLPPVLVYFKEQLRAQKETQTPSSEWNTGPGAAANSEEAMAKGAKPGQVHFFPCICDAQQIKAEFERRGCQKIR
eukprot:g25951.t1